MADVAKVNVNGSLYDIKDAQARTSIQINANDIATLFQKSVTFSVADETLTITGGN